MNRSFFSIFILMTPLFWGGCAIEPDLADLQTLDTRHLLEKLERTSSMLREQIEQTRSSTQRRDQDLSIRVKAIEGRIDNILRRPRSGASQVKTPTPSTPSPNQREKSSTPPSQTRSTPKDSGVENEASAFRSAYKGVPHPVTQHLCPSWLVPNSA